jgi:hypothetical protein
MAFSGIEPGIFKSRHVAEQLVIHPEQHMGR